MFIVADLVSLRIIKSDILGNQHQDDELLLC